MALIFDRYGLDQGHLMSLWYSTHADTCIAGLYVASYNGELHLQDYQSEPTTKLHRLQ